MGLVSTPSPCDLSSAFNPELSGSCTGVIRGLACGRPPLDPSELRRFEATAVAAMDSVCPTDGVDQSLAAAALRGFREQAFGCLGRRRDALFELVDGLLAAESMPSRPHLSLLPVHRRGWGSVYAALAVGEVDAERLATVLAAQALRVAQPVFAVDASTWALRRRVLAGPRLLLLADAALSRPADRGRLVLLLDRPARLRPRLLDRTGRCPPRAGR
jgi:hypothetical protein